jgi:hypothetical protein
LETGETEKILPAGDSINDGGMKLAKCPEDLADELHALVKRIR